MEDTLIGLIDCNNFFVSCERVFRPDLANVPVAVLSSNDGCVVARSNEVKKIGVPMGAPHFLVKDDFKKHKVVMFSSNFQLYRDMSRRVMSVIREIVPHMDEYSVDEAFFTTSSDNATYVAGYIKSAVEQWTGIPVSIGIAPTKTLAKIAGDHAKKDDGLSVFTRSDIEDGLLHETPIGSVWGVGRKLAQKFKEHDIETVGDLLGAPRPLLKETFGVHGERLQLELQGITVHSIGAEREDRKGISSSRSFGEKVTSLRTLESALTHHIAHIAEKMRKTNRAALRMGVSLRASRHSDFAHHGGVREVVFHSPVADTRMLLKEGLMKLGELYERDVPYAKVGASLGSFVPLSYIQQDLFVDSQTNMLNTELMRTVDHLNHQYGKETVYPGTLMKPLDWGPKSYKKSPERTTKWGDISVVRCA